MSFPCVPACAGLVGPKAALKGLGDNKQTVLVSVYVFG